MRIINTRGRCQNKWKVFPKQPTLSLNKWKSFPLSTVIDILVLSNKISCLNITPLYWTVLIRVSSIREFLPLFFAAIRQPAWRCFLATRPLCSARRVRFWRITAAVKLSLSSEWFASSLCLLCRCGRRYGQQTRRFTGAAGSDGVFRKRAVQHRRYETLKS